jgi:hypothetical protein
VEVPKAFARSISITGTGTGAQIKALDDLSIHAGGDIDFKALKLDHYSETKGWSVAFNYPGSTLIAGLESGGPKSLFDAYVGSVPLLASVRSLQSGVNAGTVAKFASNPAVHFVDVSGVHKRCYVLPKRLRHSATHCPDVAQAV